MPRPYRRLLLAAALCLFFSTVYPPPASALEAAPLPPPRVAVETNQSFIEGLRSPFDFEDPIAIFETVFASLPSRVKVYPTENYYYWRLNAAGRTLAGNLRLDAGDRDRGILHIGYFRYDENGQFQDRRGQGRPLSAEDGVRVERRGDFLYSVAYRGKEVLFELNDLGFHPPSHALFRPEESFVGPIFDESGLRFALVIDRTTQHFFYVLDEDGEIPETFVPAGDGLVIGQRTGFAFFLDEAHQRKILVAIHSAGMDRNSYYDGPFDQLPDNYVEQTGIQAYIESAYPHARGRIDRFGVYTDDQDARVAIMPYHVYSRREDLSFVESCRGSHSEDKEFLVCVTPDYRQRMDVGSRPTGIGGVSVSGRVSAAPPSAAAAPGGSGSAP